MYYCYILYSHILDKYYIGYTQDLTSRLQKHLTNHKGFTGRVSDWEIVYYEEYPTKTEAYARERYLKKQKSRRYIEKLISNTGSD